MRHPKTILDPFLTVFRHFFMSYFDVFGSIFEKSAMTDLPNIIVSMCLVSYNFCMIPQVWTLTFGLNLSEAWGDMKLLLFTKLHLEWCRLNSFVKLEMLSKYEAEITSQHLSSHFMPQQLRTVNAHSKIYFQTFSHWHVSKCRTEENSH